MILWAAFIILSLAAIAAVHFWWQRKFSRGQWEFRLELERLTAREQRQLIPIQAQQQAVLNSMVEGLLVLDEHGRIQLANRAFAALFDVSGDIRGNTILEALRLHELAALVQRLPNEGQVLEHELRLPG